MVQKICPICDQVIKSAHYCKNCKSWVRHPYIRDVTYYLNERHPQTERNCSYHNPPIPAGRAPQPSSVRPGPRPSPAGWVLQNPKGGGCQEQITSSGFPESRYTSVMSGKREKKDKKSGEVFWVAALIVAIILGASLLQAGINLVGEHILSGFSLEEDFSYQEPGVWEDQESPFDEGWWEYQEDPFDEDWWEYQEDPFDRGWWEEHEDAPLT